VNIAAQENTQKWECQDFSMNKILDPNLGGFQKKNEDEIVKIYL